MPRFSRRLSLMLLVAVAVSTMAFTLKTTAGDLLHPSDVFKRKIGKYSIRHPQFYSVWKHREQQLGVSTSNEVDTQATATNTGGSVMTFKQGMIFRIGEGGVNGKGKYAGSVVAVYGLIYNKYKELAGLEGTLGCPQKNQFKVNAQGDIAQLFQRGMILWSPTTRQFTINYEAR